MTFKILEEKENKLVGRKEIKGRISYTGSTTPNREEIKKHIKGNNLVIRRIKPEFGDSSAIVEAIVYNSKETMDKLEAEFVKKRNEEKKEAPAEGE